MSTRDSAFRIAVAGGGISGLSTVFYIRKMCREQGIAAEISLIEQSDRLGGKVVTLHRDGCVIERGPDSFLARKLPIIELSQELGIEDELTPVNPLAKTFILHGGKLHPMPKGLVLGIPTEVMPFVRTGIISPVGKARAAADLIIPRQAAGGDESLGGFLRRRLGREVLERVVEPLLAGIYAGNIDELSLQATFPQFANLEQKYGSLILGMIRNKQLQQRTASKTAQTTAALPPVARGAMFLTYKRGLSTLIDALSDRLGDTRVIYGQTVQGLDRTEDGVRVRLQDGAAHAFDAVVLTLPNYATASVLEPAVGADSRLIDVPYASVANVALAYQRSDVSALAGSSGFVVPRGEGLTITACTLTSTKWLHTAPDDMALIRCYVGRLGDERGMTLSDEELVGRVRADLKATMGIAAEPLFVESTRWERAMPQYPVGHLERLRQFRAKLGEALPGVFVAGSGYLGVGLPDCIAQGKQAAGHVIDFLQS